MGEFRVIQMNTMKDAAALTEQLNGLLAHYNNVLDAYRKIVFTGNEKLKEGVCGVLANIEKAIGAICFRLNTFDCEINTESHTTQQN